MLDKSMTAPDVIKRLLFGRALRSQQLGETLLPKWLALPVFASDPMSSVAYATEEIVLVLAAGGAAYLTLLEVGRGGQSLLLLVIVVAVLPADLLAPIPNGGGAFAVSLDNFGENAALVAAAALLVDYVMTVAVSVVAGVVAITSAAPGAARTTRWRCRSASSCCCWSPTCAASRSPVGRSRCRPTCSSR